MKREYQRKLPPYDTLVQMRERGMTYVEIAKKYHCAPSTVYRTIQRRARNRGVEMPRVARMTHRRGARKRVEEQHVKPDILRAWLREYIHEVPWRGRRLPAPAGKMTARQFATYSGIGYCTVIDLLRAAYPTIRRTTADKLILVLEELDRVYGREYDDVDDGVLLQEA